MQHEIRSGFIKMPAGRQGLSIRKQYSHLVLMVVRVVPTLETLKTRVMNGANLRKEYDRRMTNRV